MRLAIVGPEPSRFFLGLAICAAWGMPIPVTAQIVDGTKGEAGAPILQLTVVPRSAGLGGALAGAGGVGSVFANPAGAAAIDRLEAQLTGQTLFEGARAGTASVGLRTRLAAVVLSLQFLDLGSIEEVVCNGCGGQGTPTGRTLSASERALSLSAARALTGSVSAGVSLHHYATTLAGESGGSVSFSAGLQARPSDRLRLGASLQYVGGEAEVAGFAAPLPRTFRVGVEWRALRADHARWHLVTAADYIAMRGAPGRVGGGLEFGIVRGTTRAVGRFGLAPGSGYGTSALGLGGGLRVAQWSLDYAFQGSAALGGQHRIGVTMAR